MKYVLFKWPLDNLRPERRDFISSYIDKDDIVVQHIEDVENYKVEAGKESFFYFNYLRDGSVSSLLKKCDFDRLYLKDDFSIQFMLYILYANIYDKYVCVFSHGIKHSVASVQNATKKKFISKYFFLNLFRFTKLFIDCIKFDFYNKSFFKALSIFYYFFYCKMFNLRYGQKVIKHLKLRFDFLCLNQMDIEIQRSLLLPNYRDYVGINFKVMPFPYHKDIITGSLIFKQQVYDMFIILTSSLVLNEIILENLATYVKEKKCNSIVVKFHPADYQNTRFVAAVKSILNSVNISIMFQMTDAEIIETINKSKSIYSFYSTIVIPILKHRRITLFVNNDDVLKKNITIADLWKLGLIDIVSIENKEPMVLINENIPRVEEFCNNYGLN